MRRRLLGLLAVAALALGAFAVLREGAGPTPRAPAATARDGGILAQAPRTASQFLSSRDSYPSASDPATIPAREADWLEADEEVFGIVVGGQARAYPLTVLAFHHAVNDVVAGVPVLVSYGMVCSSGACFDPVVRGQRLSFGVEGAWHGTPTLYDRASGSVWLHITGECVSGPYEGRALRRLPTGRNTTWGDWVATHPDTQVMAREERYLHQLEGKGYFPRAGAQSGIDYYPAQMRETLEWQDDRLVPHALLYGVQVAGAARAYPFERLASTRVVEERLGGVDLTLWFHAPSRSAAAFDRTVGGRLLSFQALPGDVISDRETGSRWTLEGLCVQGELVGTQLVPVNGQRVEWYAWFAAYRQTTLWPD